LWGAGLVVLGLVLGHWFPINKNLWSPSFVVLTTGWALIAFFLLHVSIERWGSGRWAVPFVALGKNALAVFVFSELLASALWSIPAGGATLHDRIFETFFLPLAPAGLASFLFSSVFVLLMLAGSWLLLKRRVFIKI
jgi:predicted acyltransferase